MKLDIFGAKSTLIPFVLLRVNHKRKLVEVAEHKDKIQGAPTFGGVEDVTPEYEDRLRSYFGL